MPRLLCIHGFAASPAMWGGVLADLPWSWRAWCPYLLGHGPDPTRVAGEGFVGEVSRLAQGLRQRGWNEKVHLLGYSLGGRLALGLLQQVPELFASAVLIGVHPGLGDQAEKAQRAKSDESWARLLERDGLEAFVDRWQALPIFADQKSLPAALLDRQRTWRLAHHKRGLALALRVLGLGRMPCYWDTLAGLQIPVTVMVGAQDRKFLHFARPMVERLPLGRQVIVPDAGHNVVLGQPRAVAQALSEDL